MRIEVKVRFVSEDGEIAVCKGLEELLGHIARTGSVAKAAEEMGLSLSKAWKLIGNAERISGLTLITRQQGGKGGGRSELTDDGMRLVAMYKEKAGMIKLYAASLEEGLQ